MKKLESCFVKYVGSDMQGRVSQVNPLALTSQFCFAKLYFKIEVINKWSFGEKQNFNKNE